jgi:hypothetical protein
MREAEGYGGCQEMLRIVVLLLSVVIFCFIGDFFLYITLDPKKLKYGVVF